VPARLSGSVLTLLCAGSRLFAQTSPVSGTAPFVFDGNRMYAELSFVRSDGSSHRALAYVDMGSPSMMMTASLFKELELDQGKPLVFRVGDLSVTVPAEQVTADPSAARTMGSDLKVEAMLPAGVLQRFEVVLDHQHRTLTLGLPGTIKPEGVTVPFRINPQTGLIAVDAVIGGKTYPVTIDNGSAYTWFRQDTVRTWLTSHPDWERGVGAVGVSNMTMRGDGSEASGILMRIPEIAIGGVHAKAVGALGAGRAEGLPASMDLFDWYSAKNPVPVIGFIGGNVLKAFRLTIDYPNRTMYWLAQSEPDASDLNTVGLSLERQAGAYIVSAVATKNGTPTVIGVEPGDRLIRVDGLETRDATLGQVYDALHGKPGEARVLLLGRGTNRLNVRATVTAF
jgi:hypothetical protein